MGDYNHDWLHLMPPKALALTATSLFLNWKLACKELGRDTPDTEEIMDAVQALWDELCEFVGVSAAYDMIFHAPGMDAALYEEFIERTE